MGNAHRILKAYHIKKNIDSLNNLILIICSSENVLEMLSSICYSRGLKVISLISLWCFNVATRTFPMHVDGVHAVPMGQRRPGLRKGAHLGERQRAKIW